MAQDLVVGIDAGTTRVKALAVDLSGRVVAQAAEPTPWVRSGAEAQMDPEEPPPGPPGGRGRRWEALPRLGTWPPRAKGQGGRLHQCGHGPAEEGGHAGRPQHQRVAWL